MANRKATPREVRQKEEIEQLKLELRSSEINLQEAREAIEVRDKAMGDLKQVLRAQAQELRTLRLIETLVEQLLNPPQAQAINKV